jgi:hypothetical protein
VLRAFVSVSVVLLVMFSQQTAAIRSPPPIEELKTASGCSGSLHGWQWERCVIDDAVIWTALAFGHNAISYMVFPPHRLGAHIQYTPFSAEHPFVVDFEDEPDVARQKFSLPPIVAAVYIQSDAVPSTLWSADMTLQLTSSEGEIGSYSSVTVSNQAFHCDCNNTQALRDGILDFRSNIEYTADNILVLGLRGIFPDEMDSGVHWVNVRASIEPHVTPFAASGNFHRSVASNLLWSLDFAVATHRPKAAAAQLPHKAPGIPKRSHHASVSHKLCEDAVYFSGQPPHLRQRYDARAKVLSTWFDNGGKNTSLNILSASVSRDRRGVSEVEFLVWFEENNNCTSVENVLQCFATPVLNFNLNCSVRSHSVRASLETHKFMLDGRPRESFMSCTFSSSSFLQSDGVVKVKLHSSSLALHAVVPMCALEPDRHIRRIVACSQPIYNAGLLEARWPGILQAWVLYHVRHR